MSNLDNFNEEMINKEKFANKLQKMYQIEYDDLLEQILVTKQEDFLHRLSRNVYCLLEDEYSRKIFQSKNLLLLLKKFDSEFSQKFLNDKSQICNDVKTFPPEEINCAFRRHCIYQDCKIAHHCDPETDDYCDLFITSKKNNIIICSNCSMCYKSSCIKLYCTFCSVDYYTTLDMTHSENNDVQPATWEKYHCNIIYNDQMPCIQCKKAKLFFSIKENIVLCKKCGFASEPRDILWKCVICSQEFRSNAKIYNPLEYKMVKKAIKDALMDKIKAFPKNLPCDCGFGESMTHKKGCNGILYFGKLYDRDMVICAKCHSMTFKEKFIWTCAKCGKRFRDNGNKNLENFVSKMSLYSEVNNTEEDNLNNIFSQSTNESDGSKTFSNDTYDSILNSPERKSITAIPNKKLNAIQIDNYEVISQISEGKHSKVFAVKENDTFNFFGLKKRGFENYPEDYVKALTTQEYFASMNQNIVSIKGIYFDSKAKELNILEELALSDLEKEIFSLMKTKTRYKQTEIISLISQISSACIYLVSEGYLHWNISPSNILIFKNKQYKLTNFNEMIPMTAGNKPPAKLDKVFCDPMLNKSMQSIVKHPDELEKYEVFSLGLIALYLASLNLQTVMDIHLAWSTKTNILDFNNQMTNIVKKSIEAYYPKDNVISDIIINMLMFTIKKRFNFTQLSEYLTNINIDEA